MASFAAREDGCVPTFVTVQFSTGTLVHFAGGDIPYLKAHEE